MRKSWIAALLLVVAASNAGCAADANPADASDTSTVADAGDAAGETTDLGLADHDPADAADAGEGTTDVADVGDAIDAHGCGELLPCGLGDTCEDDFTCHEGCCVSAEECAAQDQPCTGVSFDSEGFVCDVPAGVCGRRCDIESPSSCPVGSWCVSTDRPEFGHDGLCRSSDCGDVCLNPPSCVDTVTPFACDVGTGTNSGTCVALGQGANLCLEAGEAELGEDCDGEVDAVENGLPCAAGLRCFEGACVEPCQYDAAAPLVGCVNDTACLPVFVSAGDNHPGVCQYNCTPFSVGECASGFACTFSVGEETGLVEAWYCSDLPGDGLPTVEVDQTCSTDDPPTNLCAEGNYCEIEEPSGTCVQYCDVDGTDVGVLADCPVLTGGPVLGDAVGSSNYGEATSYQSIDEATGEIDVWDLSGEVDSIFVALDSVNFDAGRAYTVLAWNTDAPAAALITDWTESTTALDGSTPYFSFYNVSDETLHLYSVIDDFFTTTLAPGASTDALLLNDGDHSEIGFGFALEAFYNDSEVWRDYLYIGRDDVAWGDFVDLFVVGVIDGEGAEPEPQVLAFSGAAPTLGIDEAAIQLINLSASTASVDVDWGPASMTDETGVGFGERSSWSLIEVPNGESRYIDVTLAWSDAGGGSKTLSTANFYGGNIVTVYFWDNPAGVDRELASVNRSADPAETVVAYRLINVTDQALDGGRIEAALARGVDGLRYPETGGAFAGQAGEHLLVIRDALTGGSLLELPGVYFNVGVLRGLVFGPSGSAPPWNAIDFDYPKPLLPAADSGDATVRFVHVANTTGGLIMRLRRNLVCVATEVAGIGRCVD